MINCVDYKPGFNVASFVADAPADVTDPDLPSINKDGSGKFDGIKAIAMGSDITVISPAQVWMLGSDGIWKQL